MEHEGPEGPPFPLSRVPYPRSRTVGTISGRPRLRASVSPGGSGFLPPYGWLPHPPTPALGGGEDAGRDSGGIERGTYRLRRAQAARPGSPGGPWASGSGGAREEGRGEPGAAPPTRPPRARPDRGPEGLRRRAPPRGRCAPGHRSAAGDCPARAVPPYPRGCGLVSDRPRPGDLGKPRAGEPRGD